QSTFGISKLLRWHKPGHEAKDKTTRDGRNGSLSPNAPTVLAEGSPPRRRQSKSVFVPAERFRPVHTDGNCGASYQRRAMSLTTEPSRTLTPRVADSDTRAGIGTSRPRLMR